LITSFGAVSADDHGGKKAADSGYDRNKLGEIQSTFDTAYEDGVIPNYQFGLFDSAGLVYEATRGATVLGGGQEVTLDTINWMASMTKPIVSAAIIRLVQEGKVSLDDRLGKYYPEMDDVLVAPGGSYDATMQELKTPITLRHLISHTSGLTYFTSVTGVGDVAKQYDEFGVMMCRGPGGKTLQDHMEMLAQLPLISQPGEEWHYSVSIDVLGAVIEKVTGKRLSDYLQEVFFEPLGMGDTAFYIPGEKVNRIAKVYMAKEATEIDGVPDDEGIVRKLKPSTFWGKADTSKPPSCDSGGGGIYASVNDYGRFLRMLARGGELDGVRVLSQQAVENLFQDQTETLLPEAFTRAFGDDVSSFMKFGAGFGIKMSNKTEVDYYFWGGAANTFFWLDKDNDSMGVFATQLSPSAYNVSDMIEEIADQARR
jgi:CubicO group peptidase (beta-lactamase class C family)